MIEKKQIEAYHLAEFCQLVQEKFQEGFTFDFKDNAHYPTSFGTFFTATMIKQEEQKLSKDVSVEEVKDEVPSEQLEIPIESSDSTEVSVEVQPEVQPEVQSTPTKGRPKKV